MLTTDKNISFGKKHGPSAIFKIGHYVWMSPVLFLKYSLLVMVTLPSFFIIQLIIVFNDNVMLQAQQMTAFSYVAAHLDRLIANSIALAVFASLLIIMFPHIENFLSRIYYYLFYKK